MNLQEAYNKGLTDAESLVIKKLGNTIDGIDDGPFNNPELELLRKKILTGKSNNEIIKILESMINGEDFEYDVAGTNNIIISFYDDLMKFLLGTVGMRNKLGVRMKDTLSKVKFDLTFERNSVN